MHQRGGGGGKQRAHTENRKESSAATWQPRGLLPAPGLCVPGVTRGGRGPCGCPDAGYALPAAAWVVVLLWHGSTHGRGGSLGAGRGLLPEPPPVPKTRVSGKPQGRSRVLGRCGTLGRCGLGASPLPSLPWSRTCPCSEHQPATRNDSIASPRKWEADFQVRGTKMTCIT